jgi:hypothetical protein
MKAPYKILFYNDSDAETCISPYRRKDEPYSPEWLKASVDETAGIGIQAHFLQPGTGWIPNWKSKIYPAEEHFRYYKEKFGIEPLANSRGQYLLEGGDLIKVFIDRCREKDLAPFVSLRLNDGHGLEVAGKGTDWALETCSRFYIEHPEYRIGPDSNNWGQRVLNWAIPEVRRHKFGFIKEICENYDIDGFDLDFMRYPSFFRLKETSSIQRRTIMTDFIRKVREILDQSAKPEQHRFLCVRVLLLLLYRANRGSR